MQMKKTDLIIALIRIRLTRAAQSEGLSKEVAEAKADAFLNQQQIGTTTAMSTPEGTIATIAETYINSIGKAMVDAGVKDDSPNYQAEFKLANDYIIGQIENHRNKIYPGDYNYPKDIDSYVYYRLKVEMAAAQGLAPEDIGLDQATVKVLTHTAKAQLSRGNVRGRQVATDGGSNKCFIATACYGDADAPTVLILRKYRDQVLKNTATGRYFIIWYYRHGADLALLIEKKPKLKRYIRWMLSKLTDRIRQHYKII
jgi:hypothetical protein